MYLKQSTQKNGRIYLSIADGHYDRKTKRTKTVSIKSLGYLDVLKKDYEDPIAFFSAEVDRMKKEKEIYSLENRYERKVTYRYR